MEEGVGTAALRASCWGKAGGPRDGGFALAGLQGWWVSPRSGAPFLALRVLPYLAWEVGMRPPCLPPHSPLLSSTQPFWDTGPLDSFPSLHLVCCILNGVFG